MSHYAHYSTHRAFNADQASSRTGDAPADVREAAVKAVNALIESGAISSQAACDHTITVSGHSNPGHEKAEGYARDQIQITVTQKDVDPPKVKLVEAEADATGEANG